MYYVPFTSKLRSKIVMFLTPLGSFLIKFSSSKGLSILTFIIPTLPLYCSFAKFNISAELPMVTTHFYRWQVHYSQEELAELIRKNTKTDYGQIIDLIPIERGKSGRLCKLQIVGTKKTLIIGKELEIRRTLSDTHLFSSAFIVEKGKLKEGIPQEFVLTGAGWGHGVGLCQIGAAVMGEKGYSYEEILLHYYKGADIRRVY